MNQPVLADTGPLYALVDPSDQYHRRAHRELERLQSGGDYVLVSYPTVCEAYTLVLRRLGGVWARRWLQELFSGATVVNPEPGDYQAAVRLLTKYSDQAITLVDAVVAALAARFGFPVWTYDVHFEVMRLPRWRSFS